MKIPLYLLSILCLQDSLFQNVDAQRRDRRNRNPRIVGGEEAPLDAYPFFARLIFSSNGNGQAPKWAGCGGQLVAPKVVLTAAHCVVFYTNADKKKSGVEIGRKCLSSVDGSNDDNCGQPLQRIGVKKIIVHPSYSDFSIDNDFALMILKEEVTIAEPAAMDDGSIVPNYGNDKGNLFAIGYGLLKGQSEDFPFKLMHVGLKFIKRSKCDKKWSAQGAEVTENMMCAGAEEKDACNGDSGGPLYDTDNDVLVGLTSWGSSICLNEPPGVYAQVSAGYEWIKENICADADADFCEPKPPTGSPAPTPEEQSDSNDNSYSYSYSFDYDDDYNYEDDNSFDDYTYDDDEEEIDCPDGEVPIVPSLITDMFPADTSIKVKTQVGDFEFKDFEPFEYAVMEPICVPTGGCNELELVDKDGDGLDPLSPYTHFTLRYNDTCVAMLPTQPFKKMKVSFGEGCGKVCNKKSPELRLKYTFMEGMGDYFSFKVVDDKKKTVYSTKPDYNMDVTSFDVYKCLNKKKCYTVTAYSSSWLNDLSKQNLKVTWNGKKIKMTYVGGNNGSGAYSASFGKC